MILLISELALLLFPPLSFHRVCYVHGTEVDVVCVPWVTLNRDIIGHYCPLPLMVNDQICRAVILTRSQPHNHYRPPEWTRHRLSPSQRQETTAKPPELRNLFIALSHYYISVKLLLWRSQQWAACVFFFGCELVVIVNVQKPSHVRSRLSVHLHVGVLVWKI